MARKAAELDNVNLSRVEDEDLINVTFQRIRNEQGQITTAWARTSFYLLRDMSSASVAGFAGAAEQIVQVSDVPVVLGAMPDSATKLKAEIQAKIKAKV